MLNSDEKKACQTVSVPGNKCFMRRNMLISLFLLIFAVLFNQCTVEVLSRGAVTGVGARIFIWTVQGVILVVAAYIVVHRKEIRPMHYLFSFFLLLLIGIFFVLVDILLGFAGYPSLPALRHVAHPPSLRELRKSINEYEYEFATNSMGLRYAEISLDKESPEEKRIFVMGDSYVEGQGVHYEEMFTSLLESDYDWPVKPVRFINGGLGGTAPARQMQLLFLVGFKYNIDGVIMCIYPNDVTGTTDSADFEPAIKQVTSPDGLAAVIHFFYPRIYSLLMTVIHDPPKFQSLPDKRDIVKVATQEALKRGISQKEVDDWKARVPKDLLDAADKYQFNGSALTCGLFMPEFLTTCLDIDTDSAKQRWFNLKKCLQFVNDECKARGIAVALVYIPTAYQYNADFHENLTPLVQSGVKLKKNWLTEVSVLEQKLADWANTAKVPFLDITDDFRKRYGEFDENINYPLDTHWTAIGHRIAADAVEEWLGKENFLQLGSPVSSVTP